MAQGPMSHGTTLPGIVTDQPEIYESETAHSDDTGVNDLDINEPTDDAVALIEVPIRKAFSYFAERENEIAKFYVQRLGEYKQSSDKPEEETDIEKYHRLVSEVNELLSKFQVNNVSSPEDKGMSVTTNALTSNLEVLSRQLNALEFAARDGRLDPTQSNFVVIKSKLDQLKNKVNQDDGEDLAQHLESRMTTDDTSKLIRMSALERRLNNIENVIGKDDENLQNIFRSTKCDNLTDATETLASWLSLLQQDNLQRVSAELDYLTQRLEKLADRAKTASDDDIEQIDAQTKGKLELLYNLVTATDKQRAMVPTILHRLNAMEELQYKAASVVTTVNHLEQVQSQIVESLQSNRGELTSLTEMFSKNIDLIKQFSQDIDARITAIRDRGQ